MFKGDMDIFQILSDAVSEGIVIVDAKQHIVSINTSANTMFGYDKNELIGKRLNTLIPENHHSNHDVYYKAFYNSSEKRKMGHGRDLFGLHKNGHQFPVEVGLNPFTIFEKTFVMALVVDITERKKNEKDLILKSKALQSANNGIVICDALEKDVPIIYFNTAFQELTGFDSHEILGKNCSFLQCDDRDQEGVAKMHHALTHGENCQVILRNYKKNGTLFWNDLSITAIKNSNGLVTHYICIINDITNRKLAQQERNYLSKIFDDSLNEIYVFDPVSLRFINVNYGGQKNLGYSLDELKGMTLMDIKPEFNIKKIRSLTEPLVNKTKDKIEFETIHKRKDGTTYPVYVNLELSFLGEKEIFIAIILDVTEQRNYTQKLEKTVEVRTKQLKVALEQEKNLNDLKTKFLSLVSHEFKTPLSTILTSSILLNKYDLQEHQEKREKHIKMITDKVYYLNNILDDFLSFEKLETGKVNYKFTNFRLSKLIDEVVYNANMLLKEGQQIKYPEKIEDISLTQDEKTLELVLFNLMNNAIKYSGENTVVFLKVKQDASKTTFEITDSGIGIPEKDQKNIFHRYFRAENVLMTQGTGIGLNIAKSHIENLGGSITFKSQENIGSTFILTIPNKFI